MNRILKVAKREYIESLKSKTFIISVLMAPLLVVAIIFISSRIIHSKPGPRPPLKIAVTDLSNKLTDEFETFFAEHNKNNPNRQLIINQIPADANSFAKVADIQKNRLRKGQLDIYIIFDANIIEDNGKVALYTYKTKASDLDMPSTIENICAKAVRECRYKTWNVDRTLFEKLRNVPTQRIKIDAAGGEEKVKGEAERITSLMVPFFFMYLMFFGIFVNGQHMLTSIIEEKSSRIIELLLSAVSPFELMAGKILGLTGIGLTIVALWGSAAYSAVVGINLDIAVSGWVFFYFILYYILGFLLLSSIMAGVGSICNTLKDAQNLMLPITLIYIIPIISWIKFVQSPQGLFARTLSFVPPITPMVMVLRLSASSEVKIIEILATLVLLALSVIFVIWLSAKVFRTGILMYGKKPRIREVFRWLMQS